MLNLTGFNIEDSLLLNASYESIKSKESLELITDDAYKQKIFQQTIRAIKIPPQTKYFKFQNLFRITLHVGEYYIAQCLFDFGYPLSQKGFQTSEHKYSFQLIGIANIKIDLGITHLSPENRINKFITHFFHPNIALGTEKFNSKYSIQSNRTDNVKAAFDEDFLKTIEKYDDILLTTNNYEMYISFINGLSDYQTSALEEIFSSFKFLIK